MYSHPASPYLPAYDLVPLALAAVALLAGGSCDAPGRRLARLVYRTPRSAACARDLAPAGTGIDCPGLSRRDLSKLRVFMG